MVEVRADDDGLLAAALPHVQPPVSWWPSVKVPAAAGLFTPSRGTQAIELSFLASCNGSHTELLASFGNLNKADAILIGRYFLDHFNNDGFHG